MRIMKTVLWQNHYFFFVWKQLWWWWEYRGATCKQNSLKQASYFVLFFTFLGTRTSDYFYCELTTRWNKITIKSIQKEINQRPWTEKMTQRRSNIPNKRSPYMSAWDCLFWSSFYNETQDIVNSRVIQFPESCWVAGKKPIMCENLTAINNSN